MVSNGGEFKASHSKPLSIDLAVEGYADVFPAHHCARMNARAHSPDLTIEAVYSVTGFGGAADSHFCCLCNRGTGWCVVRQLRGEFLTHTSSHALTQ
jgi:hypothetical protein